MVNLEHIRHSVLSAELSTAPAVYRDSGLDVRNLTSQ